MDVIGDCVELGTTTRPRIRVKGRAVNAGRVIMGVIDDPAVWVLHRCNNPLCVNPDHLYLGTPYDNTMDKLEAGRGCKLNPKQVKMIRQLKKRGHRQEAIAGRFGISGGQVSHIINGKSWNDNRFK